MSPESSSRPRVPNHDDGGRAEDDREILRLRDAVHRLVESVQQVAIHQTGATGQITLLQHSITAMHTTIELVPGLVTSIALLDRRVSILEKLLFGCVGVILLAVITAWLKGIIILPHTAG